MHRTQILLEDEQYERLKAESSRSGRSIGELVRTAVAEKYHDRQGERLLRALRQTRGIANEGDFAGLDGAEYVAQARRGFSRRWAEREWDS